MPVPGSINDLSTTPGTNSPAGSESPATFDDYMRTFAAFIAQLRDGKQATGAAVLLTGDQTVAGVKTFSSTPVVPNASFAFAKLQDIATARVLGRATAGTGDIEELTGTQLTALIPAASTTVSGLSELCTDTEAQTGTDPNRVVTADNLGATVLGIGQSWSSQARSVNTTYTNTTGRPIMIAVSLSSGTNDNANVFINGVQHARIGVVAGVIGSGSYVIPNLATYRVDASIAVVNVWSELR